MNKNIKMVISYLLIIGISACNIGALSFADEIPSRSVNEIVPYADAYPGVINKKVLNAGQNIAWIPYDGYVQPVKYGPIYSKVVYLTKLEAIAVAEGYRNSAFKSEMIKVLDYAKQTGSYAGGYLTGTKIVSIAKKLGCSRVATFFSSVGGAIAVGFAVDTFINIIYYLNYDSFRSAINSTNEGYYVQIKIGISNGVPIKTYKAWNSRTVWGIEGFNGYWSTNIKFN